MTTHPTAQRGASPAAIRAHYDLSDRFYRLWLDQNMVYSAALFERDDDTLEAAQIRKLDYHIATAHAPGGQRVLDIGCGWGAALRRMVEVHGVAHAVGLTLSVTQAEAVRAMDDPRIEVRIENWEDHAPDEPYDAIVSIGAMEHFVRPEHGDAERIDTYRRFFQRCRQILRPGGRLSLQTMVYGNGRWIPESPVSDIFPESDMPRLGQLMTAIDGIFELETLRNDRMHYARTVRQWARRLAEVRREAVDLVGIDEVTRYERYLAAGEKAHEHAVFLLLRVGLRAFGSRS